MANDIAQKNKVDMIHGPLAGKLLAVALPLASISILQQFFNAADVAVVGRFASSTALAAVGTNSPIINVFLTLTTGLATGGNVAISTLIGQGEEKKIGKAASTVFTLSLIASVLFLLIGQLLAVSLLRFVDAPENIFSQALLYLRIYLFAMMFAVIYNFASAILRSKGDTKRPLYCLIISGIINVILNLVFVIVLSMDVAGVALATLISNMICAGATVVLLLREEGPLKLSLKDLCLAKEPLLYTLRIGLPAGIQGMLFSISNMLIQSGINSFGSDCVAGNTAALNFEYISFFIVSAFGQTATTFTSQNYGAGLQKRCKKVYLECLGLGFSLSLLCSSFFLIFQGFFLGLFTTDSGVLAFAMTRMKCVVILECLTAFTEMASGGMRGIGISVPPTLISIMGSCVLRIIWVNTIFKVNHTIETLLFVYPVSWILLSVFMTGAYFYFMKHRFMNR